MIVKIENILVYNISYKTSTGTKPMRISFDERDGFIRFLGRKINCLVLLDYGLFDKICDRIRKIRIYSYNFLPMENIFGFS